MRKSVVGRAGVTGPATGEGWLDLEHLARVEITSEDPEYPVESAFGQGEGVGWRATEPGEQTLRLHFDAPQALRRIRLRFREPSAERRQEFVLRWSSDGDTFREIVRQQWNFSPMGATSEVEEYTVDLSGVVAIELSIVPDVSGGDARASLAEMRLG